ncbi:MAG: hypothetical protein IIA82_00905 [Thaumarchaeota archaeon]|nr:hypothetical protein [Nitrososphaerota archaeon]
MPVKLFQISQYDNDIITIDRIGEVSKEEARFGPTQEATKSKTCVRLDEYSEEDYLSRKYKTGNASEETRNLYFKLKKRILESFEEIEPQQKKAYMGFYSKENDACICTLDVAKSKIKLTYSITTAKKILSQSDFIRDVENIGIFGVGHYQSEIKDEADIEKALPYIKQVYDYKMKH